VYLGALYAFNKTNLIYKFFILFLSNHSLGFKIYQITS